MRISALFLASAALLATACNAEKGATNSSGPEVSATPVAAPNNGDWSTIVTKTAEGGFLMGNPNAKVKLVEFGSMTCPHCAEFEEQGGKALVDNYVKKGLVSWEFRNFVRDPFDMAATLLARCGGEANFFGMTRTLFHDQKNWIGKAQAADPAQLQAVQGMPPAQQFSTLADLAGLKAFAAQRGVPRAKADQCLGNRGGNQCAGADEQRCRLELQHPRNARLPDQRHARRPGFGVGHAGAQDQGSACQLT